REYRGGGERHDWGRAARCDGRSGQSGADRKGPQRCHGRSRPVQDRRFATGHVHCHLHFGGFNTSRREGIELTAGFTATINAELRVGALEETVTVTGASPLVDVQSARQQKSMPDELLNALPTSTMTTTNLAALTPGVVANANIGGASGTYASNSAINI